MILYCLSGNPSKFKLILSWIFYSPLPEFAHPDGFVELFGSGAAKQGNRGLSPPLEKCWVYKYVFEPTILKPPPQSLLIHSECALRSSSSPRVSWVLLSCNVLSFN